MCRLVFTRRQCSGPTQDVCSFCLGGSALALDRPAWSLLALGACSISRFPFSIFLESCCMAQLGVLFLSFVSAVFVGLTWPRRVWGVDLATALIGAVEVGTDFVPPTCNIGTEHGEKLVLWTG